MGQHAEDLLDFEMGFQSTPWGHSLWNEREDNFLPSLRKQKARKKAQMKFISKGLEDSAIHHGVELTKISDGQYRAIVDGEKYDYFPGLLQYEIAGKVETRVDARPSTFIKKVAALK